MSYENQTVKPTYEQLLKQVQMFRDELALMKRMYEDLFYNLDFDNFANIKEFGDKLVTKELITEKIAADTIVTDTIAAYYGDIAELTVDWIDTSRKISRYLLGDTSDMYYFEGHEQHFNFIHAFVLIDDDGEPLTEQLKDRYGHLMYWEKDISDAVLDEHGVPYIDGIRVAATLKNTEVPVTVYQYEPQLTKLALGFTEEKTTIPMILFGAGTGVGNNGKLMIYKDVDRAVFIYRTRTGQDTVIEARDDGYWYCNGVKIGGIGGGGHEIMDSSGVTLPQQPKLQFTGNVRVEDDTETQTTKVTITGGSGEGGEIIIGESRYVILNHTPTQWEIDNYADNTLIFVYDPANGNAKFGKTAYQSAIDTGFVGTEKEWTDSLIGKTAYQIAVEAGDFKGTEAEWTESLKGKSAYEIAAATTQFKGTQEEWINSLNGKSTFEVAKDGGFKGTEDEYNSYLTNIGNMSDVLDAILGEE